MAPADPVDVLVARMYADAGIDPPESHDDLDPEPWVSSGRPPSPPSSPPAPPIGDDEGDRRPLRILWVVDEPEGGGA